MNKQKIITRQINRTKLKDLMAKIVKIEVVAVAREVVAVVARLTNEAVLITREISLRERPATEIE